MDRGLAIFMAYMYIVMMVGGLLFLFFKDKVFNYIYGHDGKKAVIELEVGDDVVRCKGDLIFKSKAGYRYLYKYKGEVMTVFVSSKYPFKWDKGKRRIRVLFGEVGARGWDMGSFNQSDSMVVAELVKSEVFTKVVHSFKGGVNMGIMKVILVIGGILVVVYLGFRMWSDREVVEPPLPVGEISIVRMV